MDMLIMCPPFPPGNESTVDLRAGAQRPFGLEPVNQNDQSNVPGSSNVTELGLDVRANRPVKGLDRLDGAQKR